MPPQQDEDFSFAHLKMWKDSRRSPAKILSPFTCLKGSQQGAVRSSKELPIGMACSRGYGAFSIRTNPPVGRKNTQTLHHGTAIGLPISWGGARGVNVAAYMAVPLVVSEIVWTFRTVSQGSDPKPNPLDSSPPSNARLNSPGSGTGTKTSPPYPRRSMGRQNYGSPVGRVWVLDQLWEFTKSHEIQGKLAPVRRLIVDQQTGLMDGYQTGAVAGFKTCQVTT